MCYLHNNIALAYTGKSTFVRASQGLARCWWVFHTTILILTLLSTVVELRNGLLPFDALEGPSEPTLQALECPKCFRGFIFLGPSKALFRMMDRIHYTQWDRTMGKYSLLLPQVIKCHADCIDLVRILVLWSHGKWIIISPHSSFPIRVGAVLGRHLLKKALTMFGF